MLNWTVHTVGLRGFEVTTIDTKFSRFYIQKHSIKISKRLKTQIYFLKSKGISIFHFFQKNFSHVIIHDPLRFIWVNFLTSIKERTHKFFIAIIHFKSYFFMYVLKKWVRSALDTWKKIMIIFIPLLSLHLLVWSLLLLWLLKYRKKSMNKESRKK